MTVSNQVVARNVRRFRLERSLSLGELARRSSLSKQTLSKIEQGVGNPTVETLSLLGSALDVPVRRLLDEAYGSGYLRLSDRVVAYMVTTVPQVRQFGPTITRGGAPRR